MSEMHYDHEQSERDNFDRENEKGLKGCFNFIRVFVIILIAVMIFLMLTASCKTAHVPPVTVTTGTVISVKGDQVLVAFEVINQTPGSQGSNWFYCPKHQFVKGDKYPDPTKYSESW